MNYLNSTSQKLICFLVLMMSGAMHVMAWTCVLTFSGLFEDALRTSERILSTHELVLIGLTGQNTNSSHTRRTSCSLCARCVACTVLIKHHQHQTLEDKALNEDLQAPPFWTCLIIMVGSPSMACKTTHVPDTVSGKDCSSSTPLLISGRH